ncbi:MAG TPA: hypothetical protein PLL06_05985 [Acidobacteriota bacterium]|nr:hypothetical protein [Acidobacteriota bacterium]
MEINEMPVTSMVKGSPYTTGMNLARHVHLGLALWPWIWLVLLGMLLWYSSHLLGHWPVPYRDDPFLIGSGWFYQGLVGSVMTGFFTSVIYVPSWPIVTIVLAPMLTRQEYKRRWGLFIFGVVAVVGCLGMNSGYLLNWLSD